MGVEVDAGLGFQIAGCLKILTDAEERRERQAAEDGDIRTVQILGSGVGPSSGSLIFTCDGPSLGRTWFIRRLACAIDPPTGESAGEAYFFAGSDAADVAQLTVSQWIAYFASLPAVDYFSNAQLAITYPQRLVCLVASPTEGDTYQVAGFALEAEFNSRAAHRLMR